MPCPHFDVKVIQRSKRQSAVASAAYQSGERLFSEYDQKQKYYATLDCNQLELCGPKGHCQLSKKEADLLEVFFRYPHQLFTRERLLSRVWGDDTEIEESNLNTYIHFVRKKLKKAGICLTITTIRGVGYRLENIHD